MPVNPMQRRIRNSFILGFLISLVIMSIVVIALILKMKSIQNEKKESAEQLRRVYVATEDLSSGTSVTIESFSMRSVQTMVDSTEIITADDFAFYDKDGIVEIRYNKDGSERKKEMITKIEIPAGTILTKSMLAETSEELADDVRLQEYHMILLPTELKTGDYIDIRYSLPQGQSYIVLAKKKIERATQSTIWMKMSEAEIVILNNAIVESYLVPGTTLAAVKYPDPGIQEAAKSTYPVSPSVLEAIRVNPNIVEQAKQELYARYNNNDYAIWNQRLNVLEPIISANSAEMAEKIEAKNQEEISKIQASRAEYIKSLNAE